MGRAGYAIADVTPFHGRRQPRQESGGITEAGFAEKVLQEGHADLIGVGRAILRDPTWDSTVADAVMHRLVHPCSAKKQEVAEPGMAGWVDYVLTYEEVAAMFAARNINLETVDVSDIAEEASADGRGFAVSSGVLAALTHVIKENHPDIQVNTDRAENLGLCG